MAMRPFYRPFFGIVLTAAILAGLWRLKAPPVEQLPGPESPLYDEYVTLFHLGVAYLDVGIEKQAEEKLTQAIAKIPEEPAAWANRGLLHLRHHRWEKAAQDLNRARELAPNNPEIMVLTGLLEEKNARFGQAAALLRKAVDRRPHDLQALFALAELIAREDGPESYARYQRIMEDILRDQPNTLFLLAIRLRAASRQADIPRLRDTLSRLRKLAPGWSSRSREYLARLETAAPDSLCGERPTPVIFFNNSLIAEFGYSRQRKALNPMRDVGHSLRQFVRLQAPESTAASPDLELTFATHSLADVQPGAGRWATLVPVWLNGEARPAVLAASADLVSRLDAAMPRLPFPGGNHHIPPSAAGVVAVDWNNDFRTDLLLAGAGGLRFFQQNKDGTFSDVTARTGLAADVLRADYYGAWAVDADMDGDVDVIAAPRRGPPLLLRNQGDGAFRVLKPFVGVEAVRGFVWADFDSDGTPDPVLLDRRGKVHVFTNEFFCQFSARPAPPGLGRAVALAQADLNGGGPLDLLALQHDGAILRASPRDGTGGWNVGEVARWPEIPGRTAPGGARLLVADLDNNGCPDLIASGPRGSRVWLGNTGAKFQRLPRAIKQPVFATASLTANGRVDLLALSERHRPIRLMGRPTKDYNWQLIRLRSTDFKGDLHDERFNSFGIGSEIEVRAGLLVRKQMATRPVLHFGLGRQGQTNFIRCLWPNGTSLVEFEPLLNEIIEMKQRLPW
jgi:tetratricopeptide (TPR) repeat protein